MVIFAALNVMDPRRGAVSGVFSGTVIVPSLLSILRLPKPSAVSRAGERTKSVFRAAINSKGFPLEPTAKAPAGGSGFSDWKTMFGGVGE